MDGHQHDLGLPQEFTADMDLDVLRSSLTISATRLLQLRQEQKRLERRRRAMTRRHGLPEQGSTPEAEVAFLMTPNEPAQDGEFERLQEEYDALTAEKERLSRTQLINASQDREDRAEILEMLQNMVAHIELTGRVAPPGSECHNELQELLALIDDIYHTLEADG